MANITLNQIAYGIAEDIRGNIGDDDPISIDAIKDKIHSIRTTLLKQQFDRHPMLIDDVYTQSLGSLEIERVDSSINSSVPSNRYMYRTTLEVPSTIPRKNLQGTFTRIGPADTLNERYPFISEQRAKYVGKGRFNRDTTYSFLRNNRIYLIGNSDIYKEVRYIDVVGVFQNPYEVALFKDSNGNSLYSDDGNYPISRGLADVIHDKIFSLMSKTIIAPSTDDINNARTDMMQS